DGDDATGTRTRRGVGERDQLDEILVHRRRRRLNDEDVFVANVFVQMNAGIAVAPIIDRTGAEPDLHHVSDGCTESRMRRTAEENEIAHSRASSSVDAAPIGRERSGVTTGDGNGQQAGCGLQFADPMNRYVAALLLLAGCASSPPVPLDRAVVSYDIATADGISQQLLLNIARANVNEPIHFTAVTSIAATYRLSTSAGIGPTMTG